MDKCKNFSPLQGSALLNACLRNLLVESIHSKLWLTGLLFIVVMWLRLDFGYVFMAMNLLGITWLFLIYWETGEDCSSWRGAVFQFGFGAAGACTFTVFTFLCFGKPAAVHVGCLVYGFFAAHYLLGCLRKLETSLRF